VEKIIKYILRIKNKYKIYLFYLFLRLDNSLSAFLLHSLLLKIICEKFYFYLLQEIAASQLQFFNCRTFGGECFLKYKIIGIQKKRLVC